MKTLLIGFLLDGIHALSEESHCGILTVDLQPTSQNETFSFPISFSRCDGTDSSRLSTVLATCIVRRPAYCPLVASEHLRSPKEMATSCASPSSSKGERGICVRILQAIYRSSFIARESEVHSQYSTCPFRLRDGSFKGQLSHTFLERVAKKGRKCLLPSHLFSNM